MRSCWHWRSANYPRRTGWSWRQPRRSPWNHGDNPSTGTVVLIADFLGSAYTFRHVAPLVAERGYRVVVIEPLAIGTSSRPKRSDYSLSAQALRVAAVLDSCGVRLAIVAGQGTNAAVAVRLAAARPDQVSPPGPARRRWQRAGGRTGLPARDAELGGASVLPRPHTSRDQEGDDLGVGRCLVGDRRGRARVYARRSSATCPPPWTPFEPIAKAKEPSAIADQVRQGERAGATAARRSEAFGRARRPTRSACSPTDFRQ